MADLGATDPPSRHRSPRRPVDQIAPAKRFHPAGLFFASGLVCCGVMVFAAWRAAHWIASNLGAPTRQLLVSGAPSTYHRRGFFLFRH
jgi:hypothetical protein